MLRQVATALLIGIVGACADDPVSPQESALAEAEALWVSTRPASGSYTIAQQVACFCPYGGVVFQVTVTAGVISRVRDPGQASDLPADQFGRFRTVDQLFDEVRTALTKSGVLRERGV